MAPTNEPIIMQVVSRDNEFSGRLVSLAASGEAERGFSCRVNRVEQLDMGDIVPQLVVIDLDSMSDGILEHISRLREQGVHSPIIVSTQRCSSNQLLRAMRAGANDYLPSFPTLDEFNCLLARIREASAQGNGRPQQGRLRAGRSTEDYCRRHHRRALLPCVEWWSRLRSARDPQFSRRASRRWQG